MLPSWPMLCRISKNDQLINLHMQTDKQFIQHSADNTRDKDTTILGDLSPLKLICPNEGKWELACKTKSPRYADRSLYCHGLNLMVPISSSSMESELSTIALCSVYLPLYS